MEQAFRVFNSIVTDGIVVFVDYAVACNLTQTDFIRETDLRGADDGVSTKGGKRQTDTAIFYVLVTGIIERIGNGVAVEMTVTVGVPLYGVAIVSIGFGEDDEILVAGNDVVSGIGDGGMTRRKANVVQSGLCAAVVIFQLCEVDNSSAIIQG